MIAKHLITGEIPVLQLSDTVAAALTRMEESRCSGLPVVENGELIGLLEEKECIAFPDHELSLEHVRFALVDAWIAENEHVYEAIRTMTDKNLDVLPVVNERRQILGSITTHGLMPKIASITAANNPGGIIVLDVSANDYSLNEISQIVESNDAKILSLFITSHPDSTRMEVTIKINRIEIGPILQTFFRFNYLVNASWSKEDAYFEGLHDRFDALMNYLNI